MRTKPRFYIPDVDDWNWRALSEGIVKWRYTSMGRSYRECRQEIDGLEAEIASYQVKILQAFGDANVNTMRAYEAAIKERSRARGKLLFVDKRLREEAAKVERKCRELGWLLA